MTFPPHTVPFVFLSCFVDSCDCKVLIGGILPFGACFVEFFFILSAMWMNPYYYVFGFTLLVFLILITTCAEITVVLIYFQLCSEDYNWWWRSFLTAGDSPLTRRWSLFSYSLSCSIFFYCMLFSWI